MKLQFFRTAAPLSKGPKIPARPKAFTPNTSAFKFLLTVFLLVFINDRAFAAGEEKNPFKLLASSIKETAEPMIEGIKEAKDEQEQQSVKPEKKKRKKTRVQKLSEEREEFFRKERENKAKFVEKLRSRDMSDEERQKKVAKFYAKELEKKRKFAEKMNREVSKNSNQ